MIYRSAHLIANNLAITGELPFQLGNGVTLRRPDPEAELDRIQQCLLLTNSQFSSWFPYEAVISPKDGGGFNATRTSDKSLWHYYVLSDDDGGANVYDLEGPLLLIKPSIDLSVRVLANFEEGTKPKDTGWAPVMPHIVERYHYQHRIRERLPVPRKHFLLAESIRKSVASLAPEYAFVQHALTLLKELRKVPDSSRLQVIGLFSII